MNKSVSWLVNTSVQDMQSSLSCAEVNGDLDLDFLREALKVVIRRDEKTKMKILERYIRKLDEGQKSEAGGRVR